MCVSFNSVIRRIFRLFRFTSVRDVIVYIGSKPCDLFIDDRRFLLNMSCLNSQYSTIRLCGHLLSNSHDVTRISMKYSVFVNLSVAGVRRQFYNYACASR